MRTLAILGSTAIVLAAALGGCARPGSQAQVANADGTQRSPLSVARAGDERAGGAVVLAKVDGRTIAIAADDDDAMLHAVDIDTQREIGTTSLDGTPGQIVLAKNGHLYVAMRDRAEVAVFEVTNRDGALRKIASLSTATEPVGLAFTPDDATLVVTSGWGHEIAAFALDAKTPRFRAELPREPRAVLVSDDGKRAFVAHAVGSKMSVVDLEKPGHAVTVLDLDERIEVTTEQGSEGIRKRTSCQGFALAKSIAPAGRIFAPQVLVDTGDTSTQTSGYGSDGNPAEVGNIAVIDAAEARALPASLSSARAVARVTANMQTNPATGASTPGPECLLPRAAAARGQSLYVACLGSDRVFEYDAASVDPHASERRSWHVASGPTGIAIDGASGRAIVWSQFDRAISVIALAEPIPGVALSEPLAHIGVSRKAFSAAADVSLGRKLFHASGDLRIASDGRACASCHPDGRDDSLTWATPTGPRQTPMLAGRVADTGPFGWDAAGKDIPHHLAHTFERLKGSGLPKEEVSALAAYIATMRAPSAAKTGGDSLAARGREIFMSTETGCATCHGGGEKTTDGQIHTAGTANAADTVQEFNTPSLRFIAGTAPYFHDGRFATLRELLIASDGKMGHTKHLGPSELDALEAYLRSL